MRCNSSPHDSIHVREIALRTYRRSITMDNMHSTAFNVHYKIATHFYIFYVYICALPKMLLYPIKMLNARIYASLGTTLRATNICTNFLLFEIKVAVGYQNQQIQEGSDNKGCIL